MRTMIYKVLIFHKSGAGGLSSDSRSYFFLALDMPDVISECKKVYPHCEILTIERIGRISNMEAKSAKV